MSSAKKSPEFELDIGGNIGCVAVVVGLVVALAFVRGCSCDGRTLRIGPASQPAPSSQPEPAGSGGAK